MIKSTRLILTLLLVQIVFSCKNDTEYLKRISDNIYQDTIGFEMAVYFIEKTTVAPIVLLKTAIQSDNFHDLALSEDSSITNLPLVKVRVINNIEKEYTPPDTQMLEYFGYGLSLDQEVKLQHPKDILVLDFLCKRNVVWQVNRKANELLYGIAYQRAGIIWDDAARVCYTPEEWKLKRIDNWKDSIPNLSNHLVIHFYRENEYCRAITLGMSKFGLPDLVLNNISCYQDQSTTSLINLICQTFAEKGYIKNGTISLNIDSLQCASLRESLVESLKQKAIKKAEVPLKIAKHEEGDPYNRLLEIRYPKEVQIYQDQLLSTLFGAKDSLIATKHTEELLAASQRAKDKLPQLRTIFQAGLKPGESILVKAPFRTISGGDEWMWVEVVSWNGNHIEGILQNDPYEVPSLKSGARVNVNQKDLFDFIHTLPDGTKEGNETSAIIKRNAGK